MFTTVGALVSTGSHGVGEIGRRLDAGESMVQIADDLGVTARTLRNRLHAADLPLRRQRRRGERQTLLNDQNWLRARYVVDRQAPSTIALGLGVSTVDVRRALKRLRIERPPDHPELTATALRRAFRAGGTVSSIARAAGVQRDTVRRAMQRHGVVNPGANRGRRPAELDDAEWLRLRYIDNEIAVQAIADELRVAPVTVRRAMQRQRIPLRPYVQPRADIDAEWLRQRFQVDLAPASEIAAEAGVSRSTIDRTVRRLGLTRPAIPRYGRGDGIDPAWLAQRYVDDGHSMSQIAREAGVGTSTVRRAMVAHGIDRRAKQRDH